MGVTVESKLDELKKLPNNAIVILRMPKTMKQLASRFVEKNGKKGISAHLRDILVDSMKK